MLVQLILTLPAYVEILLDSKIPATCIQDELNMSKEAFRDRFGDDPRKDDLTVLAPKQDDPTEQVNLHTMTAILRCFKMRSRLLCSQSTVARRVWSEH